MFMAVPYFAQSTIRTSLLLAQFQMLMYLLSALQTTAAHFGLWFLVSVFNLLQKGLFTISHRRPKDLIYGLVLPEEAYLDG